MPTTDAQSLASAIAEYNKERRLNGLPEMANPTVVMQDGQAPVIEDRPISGAQAAPKKTAPIKAAPAEPSKYKSPELIQAEQDYAAELAGAEEEGVDTSAYMSAPEPSPPMQHRDGPEPLNVSDNLYGGKIGTSVGKNKPTTQSRFLYQNLSNNPTKGVRALREANPNLDFQYTSDSGPVYRDKLPQGQTDSPAEWHPLDTYGNPILHPIDYLNKYGLVGGAQEVLSDVTDETANLVSGAAQGAATVAGGLGGGLPGAMAASALSGGAANAAKQALGGISGYGDLSGMELGLSTAISAAVPAIFGTGASKAQIANFTAQKIAALKAGDKGAWDFVTNLLTNKNLPSPEEVIPKDLSQFATRAGNIIRRGGLEPTKDLVKNLSEELLNADTTRRIGISVRPHLSTATDLISDSQRGAPKRLWDALSPQSSVASDVVRWAKETVSPEYVKRMASEAGVNIKNSLGMTRRRLADFLKDTDIGQAVHRSATTAIADIKQSLSDRYDTALGGIEELQNWGDVRKRYREAMGTILDGGAVNQAEIDLHKKAVEFGDHTLVLRNRTPGAPGAPVGTVDLASEALENMASDSRLGPEGGRLSDVINSFIGREADTLQSYGTNLEYSFEDMASRFQEFVQKYVPAPSRRHTSSTQQMYDKAMAIGEDHLRLYDPEPLVTQMGPAKKLFEHLNNLSAAVNDAKMASPGVIGTLARKLDDFLEAEKGRLYDLMDDTGLKKDYQLFTSSKDGLEKLFERYFGDPVKSAGTIEKALASGARPADVKRFIGTLDRWTKEIDLKKGVAPRPPLADYAKQTAVGEALFPQVVQKTGRGAYAGGKALVQGPQAGAPGLIDQAYNLMRGPKGLNTSLKMGENPVYKAFTKTKDAAVNATDKIPFAPINRWMLMDTVKDKRHDKQKK